MKGRDWKDIGELVGLTAIVGSLIFVGLQMRQDQDIAITQIWAMADQSTIELSALVSENRDLWINGLKGEELSETDQVAFRSIALAVPRRHEFIWQRIQRLSYGGEPKRRVERFAFALYQYPGLRRAIEENVLELNMRRPAFGLPNVTGYIFEVQNALAELDRSSPPVPKQTYIPF